MKVRTVPFEPFDWFGIPTLRQPYNPAEAWQYAQSTTRSGDDPPDAPKGGGGASSALLARKATKRFRTLIVKRNTNINSAFQTPSFLLRALRHYFEGKKMVTSRAVQVLKAYIASIPDPVKRLEAYDAMDKGSYQYAQHIVNTSARPLDVKLDPNARLPEPQQSQEFLAAGRRRFKLVGWVESAPRPGSTLESHRFKLVGWLKAPPHP